jgi:transposase
MTTRHKKRRNATDKPSNATLHVVNPHAAAIDVHSDNHVVCVGPDCVQTFGAYTADLHALADYLRQHGIRTVVLESTGVYWVPLFELLEGQGFAVLLIEPSQAGHCGARPKTDVHDCQWLQRLHTFGLLRPSFRPPDSVLALRGYWRQRQSLVRYAASHVQHMQKALEQMNVKLTEVASSIVGLTGLAILQAILQGERDPHRLAALRHERCQKSAEEYAKALQGTWRPEHLFALRQSWELYQFHQRQITECDRAVEQELARLPDRSASQELPPRPRRCGPKPNDVRFEARAGLFRALGVDLTALDGLDVATVLVILGELGLDVNKFPTEKHFASWLGLCPRVARSNKAEKRRGVRKGKNRVAQALRLAAQAASRTKTALAGFYQRMKSRWGGRGAITATAHKLAVLVYRLLKHGAEYVRVSLEAYEAKQRASCERRLHRLAESLGYQVVPAAGTAGG